MKNINIVYKTKLARRYSYDDYFLIDNQFQRCFTLNGGMGFSQGFLGCDMNYLVGDKYEMARKITIHKVWKEINGNRYKV